jgi:hypothetical protein
VTPVPEQSSGLRTARRDHRDRRSAARRVGLAVLVIGGVTLAARAAPIFDPTVRELWSRLDSIRRERAQVLAKADDTAWRDFAERAAAELRLISQEARRTQQRRQGVWRWIAGTDRREDAAFKEAQRLAESDLPAFVAAGRRGNSLRERTVDEALARLDDHLAGASPYLPPIRPIENQAGLDQVPPRRSPWTWILWMIVVEGILIVAGVLWWRKRPRDRKSEKLTSTHSSPAG